MAGMKEMQQLSATSLDLDNQVIKCMRHPLKQDSNRASYKKPPRIIIAPTCVGHAISRVKTIIAPSLPTSKSFPYPLHVYNLAGQSMHAKRHWEDKQYSEI